MINGAFSLLTIGLAVVAVLGPVGAIAAMIFAPAIAGPIIGGLVKRFMACTFCIVVVAVLIACVASYWVGHHGAYKKGSDDTVAKFARGDAKLVDRALKARSKLKACQADGMRWDQTTGACR